MEQEKMNSPFQVKFWVERINPSTGKLYTEDEAKRHIKSFRKTNIEYYTSKGFSEDEAKEKVAEFQRRSSSKSKEYIKNHPECRTANIAYWLAKGLSRHDAEEALKKRQACFSLKKCIDKFGEQYGRKKWKERQQNWQNTLNSLPESIKSEIKLKKNYLYRFYSKNAVRNESFFSEWRCICDYRHLIYIDDEETMWNFIFSRFKSDPKNFDRGITYFINHKCPRYLYRIFGISRAEVEKRLKEAFSSVKNNGFYYAGGRFPRWTFFNDGITLNSKLELYFYELCNAVGIVIDEIGKRYPYSKMKYDFLVRGEYIEVAGLMSDENYRKKMKYKIETFDCVVLTKESEIYDYIINGLLKNNRNVLLSYKKRQFD